MMLKKALLKNYIDKLKEILKELNRNSPHKKIKLN
jgi:hypothetical protein